MASEQKSSLGNIICGCLPWARERANPDPSPIRLLTPAHNENVAMMNMNLAQMVLASDIPLVDINPHPETNSPEWRALKLSLEGLETAMDVFPPLKVAVGGLLECMVHVQMADQNRQEFKEVAMELKNLVESLQSHLPKTGTGTTPYSIENVTRALKEQIAHIRTQQDRSEVNRIVTAREGEEDVLRCYRRVGALFQQLQMDVSLSIWDAVIEGQMEIRLRDLTPAHYAYYSAGLPMEMNQRGGCTRDTRVKVLSEAREWSKDEGAAKIYWMNGMAGTGKTTIAYTLCEQLEQNKQLGASFFCSRSSPDCRDVSRIVPTIAYLLARYSKPYRSLLFNLLGKEPDVARRKIAVQFEKLIVEPLKEVKRAMSSDVIVVIDALDECTDTNGTKQVLDLVFRHSSDLPIKFFITSRPEPSILKKIIPHSDSSRSILHLHDIEQHFVEEDIRKYLIEALEPIRPSAEVVEQLTAQAGCLFIFAATVVRYILPGDDSVDYKMRLSTMLGVTTAARQRDYEEIDKLYLTILAKALEGKLEETEVAMRRQVLWTAICAREPLTASTLAELLGVDGELVELAVQPLRSVLHVSTKTGVISTFHASFPDFLLSKERAGRFQCHVAGHQEDLAKRCFEMMTNMLRFNICALETSYRLDKDVPGLEGQVKRTISSGLFYACQYWGDHLSRAEGSTSLQTALREFLQHRLLFWMEVLSLKGWLGHGENVFTQVLSWLPKSDTATEIRQFAYDARNLITTYCASKASLSTPHIYVSILPFTSKQSKVWSNYWPRTRGLLPIRGEAMEERERAALAVWETGSGVRCLSRSTDGKRLVSGSSDSTVSIWDVSNGTRVVGPLRGHDIDNEVYSVAFSPDGMQIASGSSDCTILLWDAYTGVLISGPLQGHTKGMCGLAFSPDSSRLVSGSDDHTIRMWDTRNGTQIGGLFEGHEDCVMSVAFSPDGKRIASGSDDHTVRVWDSETHTTTAEPFIGHTGWVDSVAFSPDGLRIASGSYDRTIRVWDSHSGEMVAGPIEGHTDRVRSVGFSPDGLRIVSGSFDCIIRVWDSYSGKLLGGPFAGHHDYIRSVLFSADGTRVFSGSADGTICVWDAQHGTATAVKSSGHTDAIRSVAFSPDGTRAVSGSYDRTICVWDTRDGTLVAAPFGGHTDEVRSVAFSPDGSRIASASHDHTLRTWDAHTGALIAGPFEGHTNWVRSVSFSPDGNLIVSGSSDLTIRMWDSHSGVLVATPFEGHTLDVSSAAFSPDGSHIVSGSWDDTIRMWDTRDSATAAWRSVAHTDGVLCVAFSPDGGKVVSGSENNAILVLDAGDGTVLHGPFTAHASCVWSVMFSPDGAHIVSGSGDYTVCVWDVQSTKVVVGPLRGHTEEVVSVAFSPDGTRVISGSTDGTIRFWDVAAAKAPQGVALSFDRPANDDGWLTDPDSQLLLWLPSDLRDAFPLPSNSFVISRSGTLRADYNELLLGGRWAECYDDAVN